MDDSMDKILFEMYREEYEDELVIIDGVKQHPDDLTFKQWLRLHYSIELD